MYKISGVPICIQWPISLLCDWSGTVDRERWAQNREELQESVHPWFSFTGGRGSASVCLVDRKGCAPVDQGAPKLA